jgi:hypothetical protein
MKFEDIFGICFVYLVIGCTVGMGLAKNQNDVSEMSFCILFWPLALLISVVKGFIKFIRG